MIMSRARFIVIDGADNSGKATQTSLLVERLREAGRKVGTLDFPQYAVNAFGGLIKESLQGEHGDFMSLDPKIASTLYAADRFESKGVLQELLAQNDVVVLDRYVSANMLHQGAKIADIQKRQAFLEWLDHVEYGIFGMPKPDLTIALFVSPEDTSDILDRMILEGKKTPDMAESDREHQKRVADCLQWLSAMKENWSTVHCSSGINGLRSREEIHEEVYALVEELL
jgi:dTMP kinase